MATWEIREGMHVVSSDGERLGKVIGRDGQALVVEKGFFFPKDYLCSLSDIREVRGDEVILARTKAELERGFEGDRLGESFREERLGGRDRAATGSQDVRVSVKEEELDVQKRMRQTGEVQIRKEVTTEQKHITVPVTKETVHVERVPASRASAAGDGRFEKETVRVPVMEEEIQVTKRPVVKEEVRISKESHTENRDVEETVRKERAHIDRDSSRKTEDVRPAYMSPDEDPLKRR